MKGTTQSYFNHQGILIRRFLEGKNFAWLKKKMFSDVNEPPNADNRIMPDWYI